MCADISDVVYNIVLQYGVVALSYDIAALSCGVLCKM